MNLVLVIILGDRDGFETGAPVVLASQRRSPDPASSFQCDSCSDDWRMTTVRWAHALGRRSG
jgi:hypothetical protein